MRITTGSALLFFVVSFVGNCHGSSSNRVLWGILHPSRRSNHDHPQNHHHWIIASSIRGGSADTTTSEETAAAVGGDNDDDLSLDEKVQKAMEKLGIANDDNIDDDNCQDGVCAVPPLSEEETTTTSQQPYASKTIEDLAKDISKEMEVHESLVLAALGATSTPVDPRNPMERKYNEEATRELIQQELDMMKNVSEDSPQVKDLIAEGFDPFLCRRALAFAEMNVDDARAILIADQEDEEEEEKERLRREEEKDEQERQRIIKEQEEQEALQRKQEEEKAAAAPPAGMDENNIPKPANKADVVFDATSEQLQELVIESPVPVLLDVYADWCGPCKALTPFLEDMAVKAGGVFRLVKLNTDKNRAVSSGALEVQALPTVFGIRDGKIVHSFKGMPKSEDFMKSFMMGLLLPEGMSEFDPPVTAAEKEKYAELSNKLAKAAGTACFSFSEREALQDRLSMKLDALVKLNNNNNGGDLVTAEETVKTLRALLSNIIKDPYSPKFRSVNLANKVIAAKINKFPPAVSILKSVGFVKDEYSADRLVIGKNKKVVNVAPLTVARNYLDKWIDKHRYEVAKAARKRKDEEDRARLAAEAAEAAEREDEEDDEDDGEEEVDPNRCQLKLRLDGKKKVHAIALDGDEPLRKVIDALLPDNNNDDEILQITCVAKRLVVKSSDDVGMNKSLKDHGLMPSASLVVSSSSKKEKPEDGSGTLSERASRASKKKKGSHTMQSVGIYAKDDNNKAELIDGGGGVWYEHDVSDDEEAEEEDKKNDEEEETKEEEKDGDDKTDKEEKPKDG